MFLNLKYKTLTKIEIQTKTLEKNLQFIIKNQEEIKCYNLILNKKIIFFFKCLTFNEKKRK